VQPRPLALANSNFTALERRGSGGGGRGGHRRNDSVAAYGGPASPAGSDASTASVARLDGLPPPRVDWQLGSFADEVEVPPYPPFLHLPV